MAALESVKIYAKLARANPDVYKMEFIKSLSCVSDQLHKNVRLVMPSDM
jgi:hypothetical protein